MLAVNGDVGFVETSGEFGSERRLLAHVVATDASRWGPSRLRIDCVSDGSGPTMVSGYLNGEPVGSIAVPDGHASFDAVGFFVVASSEGTAYRIDDVVAAAGRPAPAMSPVPPIGG